MLTAILIDDETSSRNSLRHKLMTNCKSVSIIGECATAEQALESLEVQKPDIVFLDVEMPRMNGFSLLRQLHVVDFDVIFVTAYERYAIEAIRCSAFDYLLKPVCVPDLKHAVARAIQKRSKSVSNLQLELLLNNITGKKYGDRRIALPDSGGLEFIQVHDIMYLEACQSYTRFYLGNGVKYLVCKSLKDYEELLPAELFVRIHNSLLVNKSYVEKYIRGEGGQAVLSNGVALDISKRKKADFLKAMGFSHP